LRVSSGHRSGEPFTSTFAVWVKLASSQGMVRKEIPSFKPRGLALDRELYTVTGPPDAEVSWMR
jgi:hypothetical protein